MAARDNAIVTPSAPGRLTTIAVARPESTAQLTSTGSPGAMFSSGGVENIRENKTGFAHRDQIDEGGAQASNIDCLSALNNPVEIGLY
jgi:hypothetical protein